MGGVCPAPATHRDSVAAGGVVLLLLFMRLFLQEPGTHPVLGNSGGVAAAGGVGVLIYSCSLG